LRKPAFLNDLSNYHNRGDVQNWNNKEQSQNGDFFGLDDIATEKDVVIEGFAQVYANWVNDYGIDGFRIDTAKHLDDAFLGKWWPRVQQLTAASNPDLFAFGEVYDASTATLTGFVRDRGIPATLDFAFQNAAVQFASGNNISDITNVFGADDWYITGKSNAYNQPTFLGNHDMGRFGQMLKWAGSPAGDLWGDALLGYDLMYLSRGIPNVYYGDEVGIIGTGGDQASRQDMFPTGVVAWRSEARIAANPIGTGTYLTGRDHPIQERISWLNSVRNEHPALKSGAQIQRYSENNVVAFSRIDSSTRKEYLVALNNSQVTKSGLRIKTSSPNTVFTQVWGQAQTVTSDADGFVTVWVGDRQAVVLQAQTALPAANTVGAVSLSVTKDSGVALWKPRATISNWNDPSTCTFVVQVNGGAWQVLGVDDSADWKMILSGDKFTSGAKINIAAIVKSTSGAIGISNAIQITNTP
jgi:glycosidase